MCRCTIRNACHSCSPLTPRAWTADPYWRYAAFYFWYFAGVGVLLPYWPTYLRSHDFTPTRISALMSLLVLARVVAPYFWGSLADRCGDAVRVIRGSSFCAMLAFCGIYGVGGFAGHALVFFLYGLFWSASLPQVEALTLTHYAGDGRAYNWTRVWGSLGYIVAVSSVGRGIESFGIDIVPSCIAVLALAQWLSTILLRESTAGSVSAPSGSESLFTLLKQPEVLALFVACFLMQLGHGPYYTFFSIHLAHFGYTPSVIGQLWALGVTAEVAVFLCLRNTVYRHGLRRWLMLALVLAAVRWVLIGCYAHDLRWLLTAQLLHAATFGIFHTVTVQLVFSLFKSSQQGRGQALYSSLTYGLGGAIGAMVSGYAWQVLQGPGTFVGAAAVSVCALAVAWAGLSRASLVSKTAGR